MKTCCSSCVNNNAESMRTLTPPATIQPSQPCIQLMENRAATCLQYTAQSTHTRTLYKRQGVRRHPHSPAVRSTETCNTQDSSISPRDTRDAPTHRPRGTQRFGNVQKGGIPPPACLVAARTIRATTDAAWDACSETWLSRPIFSIVQNNFRNTVTKVVPGLVFSLFRFLNVTEQAMLHRARLQALHSGRRGSD